MKYTFRNRFLKFLLFHIFALLAMQAASAPEARGGGAPFSFDSLWFYRDGVKVVPEVGRQWLTAVFVQRYTEGTNDLEPNSENPIQKKARSVVKANRNLVEYLYDPNIAADACFFRMRTGLKPADISILISQLNRDGAFRYVHPSLILSDKTYAYFDNFQMEWKSSAGKGERDTLLRAAHVTFAENGNQYIVDVRSIPFFKAFNLLAEDIRVLSITPRLVEIKPSIAANMSLFMSGGNIGDSIPFTLTVSFTDRVSIDPSSIATLNLRPVNLQKELFDCTFDPYDYAKAVTKSPIVITGRIRFYAPGEFTLPAVTINYTCRSCPDSSVIRSIETKPLLFKVSSIMPKKRTEYRLIVPTDPVKTGMDSRISELDRQSKRYQWFAVIGVAGIILCLTWLYLIRHRVSAERKRLKAREKDREIAERLRLRLDDAPAAPHWRYLGEVGTILREYILAHYGIDPRYTGGSSRQFLATIGGQLPDEYIAPLTEIFTAIDNSVSLETEFYDGMDEMRQEIRKVVDSMAGNRQNRR
jgi:hypothetical protein